MSTETKLHPIFEECCAPHVCRYDIISPWHDGEFVWATDGVILVRGPSKEPATPGNFPPCSDLIEVAEKATYTRVVLPAAAPEPNLEDCDECEGRGTFQAGRWKTVKCDDCKGKGKVETLVPVRFGGCWAIKRRYLEILIRHGASLELPTKPNGTGIGPKGMGRFRIGDIVGLVCPCQVVPTLPHYDVDGEGKLTKGAA